MNTNEHQVPKDVNLQPATKAGIPFRWVHVLPLLHAGACLTIALARLDSAWEWLVHIDAPMSVLIVSALYAFDHPWIVFGTLGTLWWYLLSRGAEMIIRRIAGFVRPFSRP